MTPYIDFFMAILPLVILIWMMTKKNSVPSNVALPLTAIAGPILVGLGFEALPVAMLALVMNSVPVSFGAVGTPTWYGFGQLNLDADLLLAIGQKTAIIHAAAALVIPVMALRFVVSWKKIHANLGFVYLSILACVVPYVLLAMANSEFPALIPFSLIYVISIPILGIPGKVARLMACIALRMATMPQGCGKERLVLTRV